MTFQRCSFFDGFGRTEVWDDDASHRSVYYARYVLRAVARSGGPLRSWSSSGSQSSFVECENPTTTMMATADTSSILITPTKIKNEQDDSRPNKLGQDDHRTASQMSLAAAAGQ